ncbi:PBSX family phage terminase large subunit [Acinetobacter baumannii]|uniref:PBSX family phage terminase large subunit n=1 Tax=Acinetobacter baumannii TaxID=470 RepID=UPI0022438E99|nr:PBSX family phage terminase large subunit [Acinetobacter baumannii]MCW8533603.1 PBSX family phage terminase large subunit [Acinetobacter baumannii]MCW8537354.1 PBSX family phage terminase large subunit [Acinetobacter baumannii]MCW8544785.1 PBSX family phage terminase large subunit [Acinetobacter baumannii]MCW8548553.1 PBSX family phage terminase large subunit [Acinetobacter baumannii]MCW8559400.1 PBSX family phage terminase large subunit [Acinetobacter baumannii]
MMEKRVPSKFKPLYKHLSTNKLFYVFHGGRGGGKSWEIADFLLIEGAQRKHRILCCREIQKSIKQSVHKLLSDRIVSLGLKDFYQILDTEIRGQNGTEFSFSGLQNHTVDSVKSFEGATITWIEEAQTVSAYSLKILIPTVVRTPNCMIIMSMNPKLPSDAVYADYVSVERDDTVVVQINYTDNKHCPEDLIKLAEQMRDADYDEYEHIYLGKPKEIADGAIYKSEFEQIKRENRICKVTHDPNLPVYTSWDLGILDPTAIWFFQVYGKEIRVIDHYEANNEPLSHYARILDEKAKEFGYQYAKHFAPHDIAARDLSSGVSREETMAKLGYKMTKGARLGVEDRIEATRQMLKNAWFDAEKCKFGIRALQNYRREFNDKLEQFKATPVHDWASHSSDAFGEGALNINKMCEPTQAKPIPLSRRGGWM